MMRYKDDPRQIAVRYPSYCEKCQVRLPRGAVAYYLATNPHAAMF